MTYEFLIYDVWGNDVDGWDVNDAFRSGLVVTLPEDATNADAIAAVYDADIAPQVEVDPRYETGFYFLSRVDQRPLGELRPVR